jgi:hypothetical protein
MPLPVHLDQLVALLRRKAEATNLDYKTTWNPADKGSVVELCKDIAAMESEAGGGYIVVGADDFGNPSGMFNPTNPADFDEQRIRSKVVRVLGEPIDFSSALHTYEDNHYVLLGIGANHDGMRIMQKDAEYEGKKIWREGEVFIRRGTSSMRWNQHEARGILERVIARRKEEWREDIFETIRRATPSTDQAGFINVSVEQPIGSFVITVTELIRRNDVVGLDVLARRTVGRARVITEAAALGDSDTSAAAAELGQQLNRLNLIAALSARYGASRGFTEVLDGYRAIYSAIDDDRMEYPQRFTAGHRAILINLFALGAILVNEERWQQVAALARITPAHTHDGYWKTLLRKAEVMAARADDLNTVDEDGVSRVGAIAAAESSTRYLSQLLDDGPEVEATTLLVQFDVMRGITTAGPNQGDDYDLGSYTNFALYSSERSEPAFLTVLTNPDALRALFPSKDLDTLRFVYQRLDAAARREGVRYHGWRGFRNPQLVKFVEGGPR